MQKCRVYRGIALKVPFFFGLWLWPVGSPVKLTTKLASVCLLQIKLLYHHYCKSEACSSLHVPHLLLDEPPGHTRPVFTSVVGR